MPLANTNVSFSAIQAEFGGANPISISEYYAGGSYVPSGTSGVSGAIPSSGAISLSSFRGAPSTPNATITLISTGAYDTTGRVYNASISVNSNGTVTAVGENGVVGAPYSWISNNSLVGSYEIRATLNSGDPPFTGNVGVWESLSTTRTWTRTDSSIGATVLKMEIRDVATQTIRASNNFTLQTGS